VVLYSTANANANTNTKKLKFFCMIQGGKL
jgi:hypothetical protein